MAAARVFSVEFRVAVAERILNGESVSALSNELKIKRSVLYRWRDWYHEHGVAGLSRRRGRPPANSAHAVAKPRVAAPSADHRVAELERRLGRLALENDFLRGAFKRVKEARSKNNAIGETRCTEK
jgi:transposase